MYKHEILNGLKRLAKKEHRKIFHDVFMGYIAELSRSVEISFSGVGKVAKSINYKPIKTEYPFEGIGVPFDDLLITSEEFDLEENAIIAIQISKMKFEQHENNAYAVTYFSLHGKDVFYSPLHMAFTTDPGGFGKKKVGHYDFMDPLAGLKLVEKKNGAYISIEEIDNHSRDLRDEHWGCYRLMCGIPEFVFNLLSCKNITIAKQPAPGSERDRKRARLRGEYAPFEYYVLEINPLSAKSRNDTNESDTTGIKHRMHLCRGHFSTYTEEKPLFGKYVGRYWIPSHVRGSAELGLIDKDYRVKLDTP
jgi:hypothetical protein